MGLVAEEPKPQLLETVGLAERGRRLEGKAWMAVGEDTFCVVALAVGAATRHEPIVRCVAGRTSLDVEEGRMV